ncbi:MAG: type II toxin-antitoxin system Phd/YefM family antitoxin [Stackebrandtia sp.]
METVGLRELSHHTSQVVNRVRNGETIVVTDHGKPVLRLVPEAAGESLLDRYTAAGVVTPAVDSTPFTVPEGPVVDNALSEALIAARDEERW